MKIGITKDSYFRNSEDIQALERISRHGYQAVDYSLANTDDDIYKLSDDEYVSCLTNIREKINSAGIEVYQTHGPWRWPPQDFTEEDRAERFDKMSKAIRGTKILRAKYFVIHPIMPFGCDADPEPEIFCRMNREFLTGLIRVGEENGVIVCLENMPFSGLSLSRPAEILKMVREINSPWLRVCLDTGHSAVLGMQPGDAVRLIGKEYLATLHVHDNDGKCDKHWIPYTGVIDWKDFSKALNEIGFDGVLSLETGIDNSMHLPEEIREYFEVGLANMAKHLTKMPNE